MNGRKGKITLSERIGIIVCTALIGGSALWTCIGRSCSHKTDEAVIFRSDSIACAEEEARDALVDSVMTLTKKKKATKRKKKPATDSSKPTPDMSRDYFAPEEQVN